MTGLTSIGGQAATMTSLELVEFINQHRRQQAEEAGQSFPRMTSRSCCTRTSWQRCLRSWAKDRLIFQPISPTAMAGLAAAIASRSAKRA